MGTLFAVGVGGGIGALARYYVASWVQPAGAAFNWGILIVNITGGLLMGLIIEASALKLNLSPELRTFLTVGILGGYTTFSTFSLDSALLLQKGQYALAAAYIIGSVVLSIAALFAGLWIVRAVYGDSVSIAPDDDGIRIDRWFKRHYPNVTHGLLEKLLRKGEVRLDGKRAKSADRVAAGQALRLPPQVIHAKPPDIKPRTGPAPEESRSPIPKEMGSLADRILYMDKQVIVIDKPPGLATQGGSGLTRHVDGMLDSLAFEKNTRPKLVHRLDRDTSGVLLVARTAQAASGLSASLALRDTSKVYWALTRGVPKQKNGVVKAALAKEGVRGRDERMTISDEDDAKDALTEYAVMATAGTEFAWVAARPITGRTHQIRVHLASLGTPIVGDFKYGGAESRGRGDIADKLHLHARSIDIGRPDGGRLQATAPLPPHMVKSWKTLGFDPDDRRHPFPPKKHELKKAAAPRPDAPLKKKPVARQQHKKKSTSVGHKRKTK